MGLANQGYKYGSNSYIYLRTLSRALIALLTKSNDPPSSLHHPRSSAERRAAS